MELRSVSPVHLQELDTRRRVVRRRSSRLRNRIVGQPPRLRGGHRIDRIGRLTGEPRVQRLRYRGSSHDSTSLSSDPIDLLEAEAMLGHVEDAMGSGVLAPSKRLISPIQLCGVHSSGATMAIGPDAHNGEAIHGDEESDSEG
jgi:hypothetical protein